MNPSKARAGVRPTGLGLGLALLTLFAVPVLPFSAAALTATTIACDLGFNAYG
jgi:hypothetical protein